MGFDGRVTRYAYSKAGHLIASRAVTDPLSTGKSGKGVDTLFDRDAFGRLLQETTPDGVATFRYNRAGQMTEAENAHRKLRWQYDAAGRLIGDWQDRAEIRHEYDAAGNRIASLLPNGEKLRIGYNAAGQFQSLHRTPAGEEVEQLLAEISRDELGRETQRLHGNGLATESQYDPQGRLQKMRLGKSSGPVENPVSGQPLLERAYGYNRSGQLSQIDDSLRGSRKYHYDALDRLTQVEGPNPEHFIHDPAHNILAAAATPEEAKQQASATQVTGNRLKFRGDTHYEYDIHGNRIAALRGKGKKLQTRYRYNSKHQLIAVAQYRMDDAGEAQLQRETQYQYDPLGRRIAKTDADKRIEFLWDGDVLLQETTRDTSTDQDLKERSYYFEPGTFKPLALSENDEIYHYHLDHLGTPDTLTNGRGKVAWSVSYKSYGNLAVAHCNEVEQPIRFQGQYFDEESGLHYNRFRFFDPECGQFTQQDPVGLLGGVNNYEYVRNPNSWIDPYGLSCKEVIPDDFDVVEDMLVNNVVERNNFGNFVGASLEVYDSTPALKENLFEHELLALRAYTGPNYELMNGALRGERPDLISQWAPVNRAASRALEKLSTVPGYGYSGRVFRGTGMSEAEVHDRFPEVGKIYKDRGFTREPLIKPPNSGKIA